MKSKVLVPLLLAAAFAVPGAASASPKWIEQCTKEAKDLGKPAEVKKYCECMAKAGSGTASLAEAEKKQPKAKGECGRQAGMA